MEVRKEISPAELKQRWAVKKNQIETLSNNIQSLRSNLTKDLKSEDEKLFLTALVISIMDKTAERVGNDESANNGHYGVTGMEKKHIKVNGDKIHFKYIGKSGVEHEKEFTDSKLADALKRAISNSPNHDVFTTSSGFKINAAKVNRYLKDFNVRAKDLRGYSANKWVIEKLKSDTVSKEEKDRKKKFSEVLKSVSEKIGHGKATLRKHYLIPELEKNYIEMGKIIDVSNKDSYEKGGPVTNDGTNGGWLKGKRHYSKDGKPLGGIPAVVGDSQRPVELEGGEVIINREASKKHWKELSRINQSAGGGVPIGPPEADADEYKKGGGLIEFNPNHLPNRRIYDFAKMVKSKYPKVWDLGGNEFGNEAFVNLERALKRGYWTDNEEWMYIKWRGYVARHKRDYQIAGVIAMLKWVDKVEKGWPYMKKLIEDEIKKRYEKDKMRTGGGVLEEDVFTLSVDEKMFPFACSLLADQEHTPFLSKRENGKAVFYFKTQKGKTYKQEDLKEYLEDTGLSYKIENQAKTKKKLGGELEKGIEAEKEHIGTAKKLYEHKITPEQSAENIAKEHLKEDPNYYTKLKRAKLKTGGLAIVNWFKSKPKVSDEELYNWARQRLDINLLNWSGFRNEQEYEEQMDQPFILEDFIKDFRDDLEDTYLRRKNVGKVDVGAKGGWMEKGGWVAKEDERDGFSVHGLSRSANPNVMLNVLFDVVPTLEKALLAAQNMYEVDKELGRVEVQGKKTRKLYYIITLNDDGSLEIQSSENQQLNSLQYSNVAVTKGTIADNRAYVRAKLFGEKEKYKEPGELNIGDIVLIDKTMENGFRGYVKVIEKNGFLYKGVSLTHADNLTKQDFQIKNATQKFSIGNVIEEPTIQDEEILKNYKTRIKNQ